MTAIQGNDGTTTLPSGHGALLKTWRCRISNTIVDVSRFSDTAAPVLSRHRAGIISIEGSASGAPDDGTTLGADSIAAGGTSMTLGLTSTRTLVFVGLISGVSPESDKNGAASVMFDFVNGDSQTFTEAW